MRLKAVEHTGRHGSPVGAKACASLTEDTALKHGLLPPVRSARGWSGRRPDFFGAVAAAAVPGFRVLPELRVGPVTLTPAYVASLAEVEAHIGIVTPSPATHSTRSQPSWGGAGL